MSFTDLLGLKVTFTQQTMSFEIKAGVGLGIGTVHAVSDCHNEVFYDEYYVVASFQLSVGAGLSLGKRSKMFEGDVADAATEIANRTKDASGDSFVLENTYVPPAYLTWLDVDTLKAGLLIGEFSLAGVKSSMERANRNDSKTFDFDWGKLGLSNSAASIGRTFMWLERKPVPRACCRGN